MTTSIAQLYQIHLAWQHPQLFTNATKWLSENFKETDAGWDWMTGRSYIDGVCYPAAVYFKNEEDYLVFRLMFSELLKF